MEAHDIKETWKEGVEKNIKPYPEEKLNEMVIKSARKSIKTVYPGTVFRLVVVAVVVYLIVMLFIRGLPTRTVRDLGSGCSSPN